MSTILERVENLSNIKQELLRLRLEEKSNNSSQTEDKSNKQIVAYLIAQENNSANDKKVDSQILRTYLSAYLPSYMIPSRFIFLDSLPLTPGGKIDMNAIKELGKIDGSAKEKEIALPSSDAEILIANIWKELLGIDQIGIHENFFELGGDSISGIQFVTMVNKEGVKITLKELFQFQTIYEIAKKQEVISEVEAGDTETIDNEKSDTWKSIVPIKTNGSRPPLFGVHTLGEGLEHYKMLSKNLRNQPLYGLHYGITLPPQEKNRTMPDKTEDLAKHYIEEMQKVQPEGPYFLIGACLGGNIAFEMAQQLRASNHKVGRLFLLDSFGPGGRTALPKHKQLISILTGIPKIGLTDTLGRIKENIMGLIENRGFEKVPDEAVYNIYPDDVVLFRAVRRRETLRYNIEPKLGWDRVVSGNLDIYDFPGEHLDIIEGPYSEMLTERIILCMDEVLNNQS
ncbi:MAG: hypothetical protein DHS20C13_21400 [Thermodesulfobacteriota bacterium]|nr:MAG: hypothetical protein DHS20C13_21400 [Thermodesulfobacteriota bacterium]